MPVEMFQVNAAIHAAVSPLQSKLSQHSHQLQAIETEMANIEQAVNHMSATLSSKLDHLGHGQREMVNVQQSTMMMTLEQFTTANGQLGGLRNVSEQGFRGVTGSLGVVDGSVKQMSAAVVQMEVIRLLNEAKNPVRQMLRFREEIDQRFAKAVENVYFTRCQYDQILGGVMREYDKKLHLIGEHIYRIRDEDFRAFAEEPLSVTADVFATLPLAAEERRLEARREALETDLEQLDAESLQPLLDMNREFEHLMASRYGTDARFQAEEVFIPAAMRMTVGAAGPEVEAFAGAAMRPGERAAELRPVVDGGAELSAAVTSAARANAHQIRTRPMAPGDVAAMKDALASLAAEGVFDPALLPGFSDYLAHFGIEEIMAGEIGLARGTK